MVYVSVDRQPTTTNTFVRSCQRDLDGHPGAARPPPVEKKNHLKETHLATPTRGEARLLYQSHATPPNARGTLRR